MTKQTQVRGTKGKAREEVTVGHTWDRARLWVVAGDGGDVGSISLSPKAAQRLPDALARAWRDPGRAVTIRA